MIYVRALRSESSGEIFVWHTPYTYAKYIRLCVKQTKRSNADNSSLSSYFISFFFSFVLFMRVFTTRTANAINLCTRDIFFFFVTISNCSYFRKKPRKKKGERLYSRAMPVRFTIKKSMRKRSLEIPSVCSSFSLRIVHEQAQNILWKQVYCRTTLTFRPFAGGRRRRCMPFRHGEFHSIQNLLLLWLLFIS